MSDIVDTLKSFVKKKLDADDDAVDRLSHLTTPLVLVVFTVLVLSGQYLVGDPITCWVPAHFTGSHESYTNSYCWIANTYYLPFKDNIPPPDEKRVMITYYQWVPIILLFQGLLFYAPYLVWHNMHVLSGVNIGSIVETASKLQDTETVENRDVYLRQIMLIFDRYLNSRRKSQGKGIVARGKDALRKSVCFLWSRRYGNFLLSLYLGSKILYILNAVIQLFVLDAFLGNGFYMYGTDVIRKLMNGEEWAPSTKFPRVTLCDFQTRRLGNVHRYTVQCVLPINMFNEKIFLIVWFWLVFLAVIGVLNFLIWITRAITMDRVRFVRRHLRLSMEHLAQDQRQNVVRFVRQYLRHDGVLILRLVDDNANGVATSEICNALWERYLENNEPDKRSFSEI